MMRDLHLSIVSHGQQLYTEALLHDLAALPSAHRLQVTLIDNLAGRGGADPSPHPFPVRVIENPEPLGFAANHNRAFAAAPDASQRTWFGVLNPDLRIPGDVFAPLLDALQRDRGIGVIAPAVRSVGGALEDSARILPTPLGLLRKAAGQRGAWAHHADGRSYRPDWIAGMFMLFPAEVFAAVGGFDERFFLYYEDVDICSRLWLAGYAVVVDPTQSIVHDAQRTSRRDWTYARWHLASILRFFTSGVYRRARRLHRQRGA